MESENKPYYFRTLIRTAIITVTVTISFILSLLILLFGAALSILLFKALEFNRTLDDLLQGY